MKKAIFFAIPVSVCNFRCHYCYLTKRTEKFQGVIPEMKYSPEQIAYAMRPERIGGQAFFNLCADGETLLTPNIADYVKLLVMEGHFIEIVSNMVLTKKLQPLIDLGEEILSHVEFKCSFHYLQLKDKNLLNVFAQNVQKVHEAGASICIEITPSDELIPYIDEVKKFSLDNFGALPHLTIARDDSTGGIVRLTKLSVEEYNKVWSIFDSEFWKFKTSIFGVEQKRFCYAGSWSYYVNMATGDAVQCYCGSKIGNVFECPDEPLPQIPIARCSLAHCYNGHAFMTMGAIPDVTNVRYGDIRDKECINGEHWLQPELKQFFNGRLEDSNKQLNELEKNIYRVRRLGTWSARILKRKAKEFLK